MKTLSHFIIFNVVANTKISLSSIAWNVAGTKDVRSTEEVAFRAIDGVYEPVKGTREIDYTILTGSEKSPWVQADLLSNHYILAVEMWNRNKASEGNIISK